MLGNPPPTDGQAPAAEPHDSTLVGLLSRRAAERPKQAVFVWLDETGSQQTWTYADLAARVDSISAHIAAEAKVGDRALLVYPPGLEFIAGFLGCMRAGVLPVPATYPKPRRPLPRLDAIAVDCEPTLALTTADALATMQLDKQSAAVRDLRWIATDEVESSSAHASTIKVSSGDPAFLQYTSGSTSEPRGVVVSHANLRRRRRLRPRR